MGMTQRVAKLNTICAPSNLCVFFQTIIVFFVGEGKKTTYPLPVNFKDAQNERLEPNAKLKSGYTFYIY